MSRTISTIIFIIILPVILIIGLIEFVKIEKQLEKEIGL